MLNHLTIAVRDEASPRCPHPTSPELSSPRADRKRTRQHRGAAARISTAVADIPTEVVFLDDSDDATPDVIRTVAHKGDGGTYRISLIRRQGSQRTGGPAGAVVDGLRAARAPWACVLERTFSILPRVSLGCSPRRTATGPAWWWPAGTASRDAPKGSGLARGLISTAPRLRRGCCSRGAFAASPIR